MLLSRLKALLFGILEKEEKLTGLGGGWEKA